MTSEVQELADQLADIIGAFVTSAGPKGRNAKASTANLRARPTPGGGSKKTMTTAPRFIHAGIPEEHWPVAYLHACHILNRMPQIYIARPVTIKSNVCM